MMSCKTFIASFLCCSLLSFSGFSYTAETDAEEEITDLEASQHWFSAQACTEEGCMWRAMTLCPEDPSIILMIIQHKDADPFLAVFYNDVPLSEVSTWETESVPIKVKLRVDKRQTYTVNTEVLLLKKDREMIFRLDLGEDIKKALADMKAGHTVRLRLYGDNGNLTIPFSLAGATKAINRVTNGFTEKPFATTPDPYFDDMK